MAKLVIEAEKITSMPGDSYEETTTVTITVNSQLAHQRYVRIEIEGVGYLVDRNEIMDVLRLLNESTKQCGE